MSDDREWERGWSGLGEADARPLDMAGTCAALMRMRGGLPGSEEADVAWVLWVQALVLRLHRGLDEAEALGLAAHLTQSALIWRWIGREKGVALPLDLDRSVVVPARAVTPLARIAHEVVTRCFERFFSDGRGGRISLGLRRDGDAAATISITIRDRGQGQTHWSRMRRPADAGIVRGLADDAGADLSLVPSSCGGTTVRLRFPSPL